MSSIPQPPEEVWVKTEQVWDEETSGEELRPPELVLTEHVHIKVEAEFVKEEPKCIKKEPEWEYDGTSGAGLDACHQVEVEFTPGPDCPEASRASELSRKSVLCAVQVKEEMEYVKHETEWDESASLGLQGMSETAALPGLYAGHVVTQELVLGPERPQPPDIGFRIRAEQAREVAPVPRDSAMRHQLIDNVESLSTDARLVSGRAGGKHGDNVCSEQAFAHYFQSTSEVSAKAGALEKRYEGTGTVTKPFSCDICKKKFTTTSNLKMHERIHTGERPHSCGTCQQKFTRLGDLKKHEQIHTGERSFICKICEQGFRQLSDLKRHERIHTGAKPYSCGVCRKMFTRLGDLQAHERIHAGEKPYLCQICNKSFTQSGTLRKHERTHTEFKPYSCAICGQKFKVKDSLKIHERSHTGEKPYACNICQKKFVTCSHLKRHERTHARENP